MTLQLNKKIKKTFNIIDSLLIIRFEMWIQNYYLIVYNKNKL